MKFWKDGFYLEKENGSVAITDEYWQELLDKQSNGYTILSNNEGYPIAIIPEKTVEQQANSVRKKRNSLIEEITWRKERYYDELSLDIAPTEDIIPILKYIQSLRDITEQEGFPTNVTFPEIP